MADPFRQLAFAVEAFSLAHLIAVFLDILDELLHFLHASRRILLHSFVKLLHAELHVVEIGNGFAQLFGNVCEHGLKLSEFQSHQVRRFRRYGIESQRIGDEFRYAPVMFPVKMVSLSVGSRNEAKHLPVDFCFVSLFKFLADMSGYTFDVVLKQVHVLKYLVVDALKDVVA